MGQATETTAGKEHQCVYLLHFFLPSLSCLLDNICDFLSDGKQSKGSTTTTTTSMTWVSGRNE